MSKLILSDKKFLPQGWIKTKLVNIANIKSGGTPSTSKKEYWNGDIPWINSGKLKDKLITEPSKYITKLGLEKSAAKLFPKDTVLIALTGATTSKVGYLTFASCTNQSITGILSNEYFIAKYIFYALIYERENILKNKIGTAQHHINQKIVEESLVSFCPLNEQKKIVKKIEELFSLIDNIYKIINEIKSQIILFEKSVFHASFIGTLSQHWRNENEPIDSEKTVSIILEERKRKWESEQLEKFKKMGKIPKNQEWKKKYKEPMKPNSNLPIIPDSWKWITLDQICWQVRDGPHYSPKYSKIGIPFITGGNVRPDGVDFENCKKISSLLHEELIKRCEPKKGDILYTKGGTTGIARVNTYDEKFSVWVHVAVLKLVNSIKPFFVQHALNSPFCYQQSQKYTHGVGNQDLGLTRMIKINLTLPSMEEQDIIIKILEKNQSEIKNLTLTMENLIQFIKNLKIIILKKAFNGELVPQDPNDESAKILLQKIKQEKEQLKQKEKAKRRKKNVK